MIDHATSSQHKAAMDYLKFDQAKHSKQTLSTIVPIISSLQKLDATTCERLRRKFELAFIMAKEGLPFTKYAPLHRLEVRHEVDLGISYATDIAVKTFTYYIADSQRRSHNSFVKENVPYFSFMMDETTGISKVKDEVVVMLYYRKDEKLSHTLDICQSQTLPSRNVNGLVRYRRHL